MLPCKDDNLTTSHFTRSTWGEIRVKWKTKEEVNYPTPLLTSRWFQTKYRKPKMAMMTKQTKSTRKYFSGLGIGFRLLSNWWSWSFSHWIWTIVALLIVSSVANCTFTASARLHFGDEDDDNAEVSFFFSTCTSKTTDLIVSSVSISSNFRKPISCPWATFVTKSLTISFRTSWVNWASDNTASSAAWTMTSQAILIDIVGVGSSWRQSCFSSFSFIASRFKS